MFGKPLAILGAAAAGATAGYVVHQLIGRQHHGPSEAPSDLTIGAPLVPTAVALGVGLVSGRRSLLAAAVVGFTLSAAAGPKIDLLIPAIRTARERLRRSAPQGDAPSAA